MVDPVDSLVLDLLEWVGPLGRPYDEVMEVWRSTCPRLAVIEEARRLGLVATRRAGDGGLVVVVTDEGRAHLAEHRTAHGATAAS